MSQLRYTYLGIILRTIPDNENKKAKYYHVPRVRNKIFHV